MQARATVVSTTISFHEGSCSHDMLALAFAPEASWPVSPVHAVCATLLTSPTRVGVPLQQGSGVEGDVERQQILQQRQQAEAGEGAGRQEAQQP